MKKLLLAAVALALVVAVASPSNAQGKMVWGVAVDVLIPTGTFGDAVSAGFGGDGRFQYGITPMFAVHGTVGYFIWSGKDFTSGGITVKGADFKGFTIRVGGKYYFMPEGGVRVYGLAEIGLFFSSTSVPSQTIGGFTFGGGSVSNTNFTYVPAVGVEIPAGPKLRIDLSVRYDGIATSGSSSGSLGFRAGVNFPI